MHRAGGDEIGGTLHVEAGGIVMRATLSLSKIDISVIFRSKREEKGSRSILVLLTNRHLGDIQIRKVVFLKI
ncbi:hypothetical protein B296_00034868 [Ensete ventricosum]|uniref:Uncharacterized protein n=1 Tax=Ensete ventricosum TaxID=4639 RepID=A0A426Y5K6_ENSVE|nr:hypothetical protein B296_00034868 [Ensete ventricosum]